MLRPYPVDSVAYPVNDIANRFSDPAPAAFGEDHGVNSGFSSSLIQWRGLDSI